MKKEQISAMIGIVLVFVIAIGFITFCKVTSDNTKKPAYDFEDDGEGAGVSWADRGYTVYRPLSDQVQKLLDTDVFAPTEEYVKIYKEYNERVGYENSGDEILLAERQDNYQMSKRRMEEAGNPELLEQDDQFVFGPQRDGLEYVWEWDAKE